MSDLSAVCQRPSTPRPTHVPRVGIGPNATGGRARARPPVASRYRGTCTGSPPLPPTGLGTATPLAPPTVSACWCALREFAGDQDAVRRARGGLPDSERQSSESLTRTRRSSSEPLTRAGVHRRSKRIPPIAAPASEPAGAVPCRLQVVSCRDPSPNGRVGACSLKGHRAAAGEPAGGTGPCRADRARRSGRAENQKRC